MSIWGKMIGGVAGFALGGPLGALLGAAAGHAVDKMRAGAELPHGDGHSEAGAATRQVAFTIAVIALSAKMAKADGRVTRDEIRAFKEVFRIPPQEMKNVGRIFDQAKTDTAGYEVYARQIAAMFRDQPAVLEELLGGLFHIAKADGVVHPSELEFITNIARIFGFDPSVVERLRAAFTAGAGADPYGVLGVPREASDQDVKNAYRKLIRENHPDKLMAQGLPEEFIELANEKMTAINGAYDTIKKERGLK
ncbi:TerB family tellurite resistance protein [Varunaivibrio sulfuroxidans]|uniref:DnaJ like chaperone protein n=1 Tax=Varunaivibrio sulfuroxidans TaxID=1773489 RepID=A0A4R3J9F9_9PROT|nr:TerB family tellurite resistance protein [Varunaivibrio sulfuroxidans]TCS62124.1 DnaJ like chaperone protein [Varunaivibrio sulfuroxidans]WES30556.1 TerB family tellurite resistance protein [Varunaivibrio sulfuroxidans]